MTPPPQWMTGIPSDLIQETSLFLWSGDSERWPTLLRSSPVAGSHPAGANPPRGTSAQGRRHLEAARSKERRNKFQRSILRQWPHTQPKSRLPLRKRMSQIHTRLTLSLKWLLIGFGRSEEPAALASPVWGLLLYLSGDHACPPPPTSNSVYLKIPSFALTCISAR